MYRGRETHNLSGPIMKATSLCVVFTSSYTLRPRLNSTPHNPTTQSVSASPSRSVYLSVCQSYDHFLPSLLLLCDYVSCAGVLCSSQMCVYVCWVWCVSLPLLVDTHCDVCVFASARVCVVSAEISSNYLWPLIYFSGFCVTFSACSKKLG